MLSLLSVTAFPVALIIWFYLLLRKKRAEMDGLPSPPMSLLWGHLKIAGECNARFPPGLHPHSWFAYIQRKYKQGDIFYLDWWPFGPRWLFIANPEIASQYITTVQSLPKSPLETSFLDDFLGHTNMVSAEGRVWKQQRAMFNPGFASNHLMTLVPYIVDSSLVFYDVLKKHAESNELCELEELATRLTIDIIGKVVLDSDFDSQKQVHPIVYTFRDRVNYMPKPNPAAQFLSRLEFPRRLRLWWNGRELDRLIGEELDRKIAARVDQEKHMNGTTRSFKERKRSAVDLALDAYQKEFTATGNRNTPMDAHFRKMAIDSMKTFIFAGHDTTASTIAYMFYALHSHPLVHAKLVKELDAVFGENADAASIADQIKKDPYIVNKLDYTNAVIKETLRIWPPASTLRWDSDNRNLSMTVPDPKDSSQTITLPLSGFHIWPIIHLINRNEAYFPQPWKFIPERFLRDETPFPDSLLFTTKEGKDAFRPFEKGPRSCIGEGLAILETKIIIAITVKDFDFECEFDGKKVGNPWVVDGVERGEEMCTWHEIPEQKRQWDKGEGRFRGKKLSEDGHWLGRTVEGHQVWQILRGAAKPRGGMPGRLSLR
jgi:cytochrome P450